MGNVLQKTALGSDGRRLGRPAGGRAQRSLAPGSLLKAMGWRFWEPRSSLPVLSCSSPSLVLLKFSSSLAPLSPFLSPLGFSPFPYFSFPSHSPAFSCPLLSVSPIPSFLSCLPFSALSVETFSHLQHQIVSPKVCSTSARSTRCTVGNGKARRRGAWICGSLSQEALHASIRLELPVLPWRFTGSEKSCCEVMGLT